MPVTLRMAFRNLVEHRAKSLIIGILLAMGSLLLVVGNSFIDASGKGIRTTFTESYTGDVFISGISADGPVSLFGVTSIGGLASTPTIPDYEKVMSIVKGSPLTDKATGMATGFGIVTEGEGLAGSMEEEGGDAASRFLVLFGIDAHDYWQIFNSVDFTAGKPLEPGQQGIVLYDKHMENLSKLMKKDLKIGDTITVQGISASGFRIREIPIAATYHQKGSGASPEQMAFVDIDTLRVLSGMTVGANESVALPETALSMLGANDPESLFGGSLLEEAPGQARFDESAISRQLAETGARTRANTADTGAWQFIIVRTKHPADAGRLVKQLNQEFAEQGLQAQAGNWQKAAGPYGQSVDVIRLVFVIAIIILSVVAIIIIMNTFVISVIERTGEIGTMRAIGADRSFIRRLFAEETLVLSGVFSLAGALLGTLAVAVLRALRIAAGNPFFELLFGGRYLSPFVTPVNFISAVLGMMLVGYLAHLYPVSVALKIEPVRAMQNE